jgi:filamentous hemagglutinin
MSGGREASKAVGNFAASRIDEIKAQQKIETDPAKLQALKTEQQQWEEGGVYRIALHTAA